MRILFSLKNLELGGAQMFVLRLANAIAEPGEHEVYIFDHDPEIRQPGILDGLSSKVKVLTLTENPFRIYMIWKLNMIIRRLGFNFYYRQWLNIRSFKRALKKYRIDIVNSHMAGSDLIVAQSIAGLNVKFISTMHGEYELNREKHPDRALILANEVLPLLNGIIYTAEKNLEAVLALKPGFEIKLKKIPVGFDAKELIVKQIHRKEVGIPENAFVAGMVARGIPEKGWDTLIEVMNRLSAKFNDIHSVLIGNGKYLKNLVRANASPNLHLLQFEEKPLDYFSYISLFDTGILLSHFSGESVPNSVIEYLYWQKPVIATRVAEIPSMIRSGEEEAGILVPLENGKASALAFEKAILAYYHDRELLKRHKALTEKAFMKFDMQKVAGSYIDFFSFVKGSDN